MTNRPRVRVSGGMDTAGLMPLCGEAHLLSTDGFWMDFPPRRLDSVVRVLQGQRRAYIDSGVDLLSGKQWEPTPNSVAGGRDRPSSDSLCIDHKKLTACHRTMVITFPHEPLITIFDMVEGCHIGFPLLVKCPSFSSSRHIRLREYPSLLSLCIKRITSCSVSFCIKIPPGVRS